jgi:hypothetical protein
LRISDEVRRLNPDLFGPNHGGPLECPTKDDLADPPPDTGEVEIATEALNAPSCEADLQNDCEKWLSGRGYGRRTPKKMQDHQSGRWFIHLHEARGNPILLDLLLLDSEKGSYIEIELKVKGGRVSPDQQALVFRGEGDLAWNLEEFKAIVERWETQDGKKETVDEVSPAGLVGGRASEDVQLGGEGPPDRPDEPSASG